MAEAFLWGFVGAASLMIGAALAIVRPPGRRLLGLILGFGAGVLISALAFELVGRAVDVEGGLGGITFGLYLGCAAFLVGDVLLHRLAGESESEPGPIDDPAQRGGGLSIALGAVLDGVPECAVLGLTILEGGSVGVAMLVAVFISNLPEGIAATTALLRGGWLRSKILILWAGIVVLCGLASPLGYALLDGASPWILASIFAFAAGAILTMLATSMMPLAYAFAGRMTGAVTVVGFGLAFAINWVSG
jgi:ZIP family zinc transporter